MVEPRITASVVKDLEHDSFDVVDFVDRLVWRITNSDSGQVDDVVDLKNKLEEEVATLQIFSDQFEKKLNLAETKLKKETQAFHAVLKDQSARNEKTQEKLEELDEKTKLVSAKAMFIADQLKDVCASRERASAALQTVKYFYC